MSRLEEESTKKHIIVDRFHARINHLKMIAFTFLLFVVYTIYLWFVCSARPMLTSSVLLFISQIAIGFPATRAYYEWGRSNKEKLQFIDPARVNEKGTHIEIDIHLSDIPLIFEKMELQVERYDRGNLDDLNDLAWFGIIVWAAISSAMSYLSIGGYLTCIAGAMVLEIASVGSYMSGYWKARTDSFADDLSHLQYFVETRYRELESHLPRNAARLFVQMKELSKTTVMFDFSVEVPLGPSQALEYHMGLSSAERERIVIRANEETLNDIIALSKRDKEFNDFGWICAKIIAPSGPIVQFLHESSEFSLTNRASFIKSPSIIDKSSRNVGTVFSHILGVLK
ncbi:MAG: hypothetical protein ACFFCP_01760 [Promethearchaeota archaeon]